MIFLSQVPPVDFSVASGAGLNLRMGGVPIVRGTWFQYYEGDWSKGYYSSGSQTQKVVQQNADTVLLSFKTGNGLVAGTQTYKRTASGLEVNYHFEWHGEKPVKIECGIGQVWAPAMPDLKFQADDKSGLIKPLTEVQGTVPERTYVESARSFAFKNGLGEVKMVSDLPFMVFDARSGYRQEWAEGKQLLWAGQLGLEISKEKPIDFTVRWSLDARSGYPAKSVVKKLDWKPNAQVESISDRPPVRIPLADKDELDLERSFVWDGKVRFPKGKIARWDDFTRTLGNRIDLPVVATPKGIGIECGIAEMGLATGGFRITLSKNKIEVLGQDDEGLRSGLMRLALTVFVKDGKVKIPTGMIEVSPKIAWRGVHLFVGPDAREFQTNLFNRALRPLGFNKVVLQCEQTRWDALNGAYSSLSMPKIELKRLFDNYRLLGVEPIPLIQSFGHAEWLFRNKKNLEIAYNPADPYSIDPRKPAAREKIAEIWREAVALLKPKTIHFGLDEVDMRGFEKNPKLVTELWGIQVPFLQNLAQQFGLPNMIWGDKALGPGEAPDAALGDTKAEAAARRAVIKKGTWITDWHYKADERPEVFTPVIKLWKKEGMNHIAANWFRPENVRGFTLAAAKEGAGVLQTTWAGYESNEAGMIRSFNQFTAMVLAVDYAVSGRQDLSKALLPGSTEALRTLYFDPPVRTTSRKGWSLGDSGRTQGIQFGSDLAYTFQSALDPALKDAPTSIEIPIGKTLSQIALRLSTTTICDDADDLAIVEVKTKSGGVTRIPIKYGWHVRALTDQNSVVAAVRGSDRVSLLRMSTPSEEVTSVRVVSKSSYAGLRLEGISLIAR